MKVTITFELPEETSQMQDAVCAAHAWQALEDISRELRSHEKHDVPLEVVLERVFQHLVDARMARGNQ